MFLKITDFVKKQIDVVASVWGWPVNFKYFLKSNYYFFTRLPGFVWL